MRKLSTVLALALAIGFLGGCGSDEDRDSDQDGGQVADSSPDAGIVTGPVQLRLVAVPPDGRPTSSEVPDEWTQRFQTFTCPEGEVEQPVPDEYALTCDTDGMRYLLSPASWTGAVQDASVEIPDKQVAWVVVIDLDEEATRIFADLTTRLAGTGEQLALVLDGRVLSAPTINAAITDGKAQIEGAFAEADAHGLADAMMGR